MARAYVGVTRLYTNRAQPDIDLLMEQLPLETSFALLKSSVEQTCAWKHTAGTRLPIAEIYLWEGSVNCLTVRSPH